MNLSIGLRNLRRVREILVLVLDYGFGYVVDQLDLDRYLPLSRRRRAHRAYAALPLPRRLRLALAQLGPTFIKLGQMLSTRSDLLPSNVVAELRHLQDEAPAVPFEQIRGVIETDLGRPVEECFARLEAAPLASASLGQVHAGTLADGSEVTVKVLRPGAVRVVEEDLQILSDAAHLLHRQAPSVRRLNLPGLARQFASQIEDELNYTHEAHSMERLRRGLSSGEAGIRIPSVKWDLTTERVLTTERLRGTRVDQLDASAGIDRRAAAREFGRYMLQQIFVEGVFHGDPHQGNVLIGDDGTVILLDFGIVGYLDPRTRELLVEAVRGAYDEDTDGLVSTMCELGAVGADTDFASLRSDLARVVGRFAVLPGRRLSIGRLLGRALRALWLNNVRLPPELSLTAKALLMTEAVCSELDPEFDFRDLTEPVVEEARAKLLAPGAVAHRVVRAVESTGRHVARLPGRIDRVLSLIEHGGLRMRTEEPESEGRWSRLGRCLNRLGLSLLAAALVVASSMYLVAAESTAHVTLGIVAMVAGVLLAGVVIVASLRPGQV